MDTWKTDGYVIGSPAYRMSFSDTMDEQSGIIESPQNGWVLINKISLSSEQAEELLKFLVSEEHALILIAANDDRDIREACVMVIDLLIERGRKKKELRESELDESKVQRKVRPISLNGEYLTVSQMAEICSVSVKQIKKWIRKGDIEAIDLPGAEQIVEMGEFIKFLNGNEKLI